jgi:hypothetical protein
MLKIHKNNKYVTNNISLHYISYGKKQQNYQYDNYTKYVEKNVLYYFIIVISYYLLLLARLLVCIK